MSYKSIGDFIRQVNVKNDNGKIENLLGVNLDKVFIPSVANLNGVDITKYKVIKKGQFGCKLMSVGRDKKLPISHLTDCDKAIISSAYYVFEVKNEKELLPEYLMMWFLRPESDRFLWFLSGGDVRGRITWEDLCSLPIKVPPIEKQQQIVAEYNTVTNRIQLNEQINQNLEATAQALYKHWFVDFEFPIDLCQSEPVEDPNCHLEHVTSSAVERREVSLETLNKIDFTKGYKSSGGKMVYNEELDQEIPEGWSVERLENIINENPENISKEDDFKEILYLETSNITKNKIDGYKLLDLTEDSIPSRAKRKVRDNDIIYSTVRPALSHYGLIRNPPKNLIVSTGFAVLRITDLNFTEVIYQFLISKEITKILQQKAEMSVSTYPSITVDDILNLQIALPNDNSLVGFRALNKKIKINNTLSQTLQELQSLLLAKMTQGVTKTVGV